MIEVLTQLRVLQAQSGKSYETIAANTGHSKATVNDILTGKREDVRLQTVLDIAAELGADVALVTEQSRKAISEQDISFYRDEIAARETDLETLRSEIALLRAERVEEVRFYRDQIALLRDQINRKDGWIDLVAEVVARNGGDLKSVQIKKSEAD
jgi:transcriptional regulator with XRE-family HTH domain